MVDTPKVEFAVGSEVSPGSFYKSAFARSFALNTRETKSLDFGFTLNYCGGDTTINEEPDKQSIITNNNDNKNNNFFNQNNNNNTTMINVKQVNNSDVKLWRINEISTDNDATIELDKLRKECQSLSDENRRLQATMAAGRTPHSRVIDNVLLQTQIDTLQWQLKQTEANRQMYRALMGQVVRFLDRAHKSLDILHEKCNPKSAKTTSRVPRSRSVHAVDGSSPNRVSNQSSNSFARAKSVTQISPTNGTIRETSSVWSVLRRNNETANVTQTTSRPESCKVQNQSHDGVVYRRRPKQSENNPDEVPPERLSQEAFRLMRTVQSLLATREPDLVRVSENDENVSPSPTCSDHDISLPQNFANSTSIHESSLMFSNSRTDHDTVYVNNFRKNSEANGGGGGGLLPGARRSLDATSLHSGSSKTTTSETTEEEDQGGPRSLLSGVMEREFSTVTTLSSTPNRRNKSTVEQQDVRFSKAKTCTTASVSSAEDESGFSSMSSFQDVGIPATTATAAAATLSPIKGCHTEVGLPEVPFNKVRHRRWSSTPAEMQAILNARHNASFNAAKTTSEALKVLWV